MYVVVNSAPKYRRRRATAALVALALASIPLAALVNTAFPIPTEPVPADCQEDEPCWDCSTMGNGVCGPLTLNDGYIIDSRGRVLGAVTEP